MTFVVYSKRLCPYCDNIVKILNELSISKGYSVIVYELNTDFNKDQFLSEFGEGSTFPQILLNDKHLGGCLDTVKYLRDKTYL